MEQETIDKIGKVVGVAALCIISYKLIIIFPKLWREAKSQDEKWSALTVLL